MTRAVALLLGIVIGVLIGAAAVVVGFNLGAATAAVPSRPAPVVFRPLPRPASPALAPEATPGLGPPADEPTDAGQGDPSPVPTVTPAPRPTEQPTMTPTVSGVASGAARGLASWYSVGHGLYAAAGPALRVGDWRGRVVEVCAGTLCLAVRLVDWCACGDRPGGPTVIDLSRDAFALLAPPSRGLVEVTVTW